MEREKVTKAAAIIIGLILAGVVIFFGFRILSGRFGRADVKPSDIAITKITANSFVMTFKGSAGLEGRMLYADDCPTIEKDAGLFAPLVETENTDGDAVYEAEATLLSPATKYYAALEIAGKKVGSDCFEVTTTATNQAPSGFTTQSQTTPTPLVATPTPSSSVKEVTNCDQITVKYKSSEDSLKCIQEGGFSAFDCSRCLRATPTPGGLGGLLFLTPSPTPSGSLTPTPSL